MELWNTANWRLEQTLAGHEDDVRCVAFSPDGRVLASGSSDETIRLWNPKAPRAQEPFYPFPSEGYVILNSQGMRHVVVLFTNGTATTWEVPSMRQTLSWKTNDFPKFTLRGCMSSDGTLRAWGGDDGSIAIADLRTRRILTNWVAHENGGVQPLAFALAFAYDKSWLLSTALRGKELKCWELNPLRERWATNINISEVIVSTNDQRIYVQEAGQEAGRVAVLDARTGHEISSLDTHKTQIGSWNVSWDGRKVITTAGSEIKVWSIESPAAPLTTLRVSESITGDVAFSPDARRIIVTGEAAVRIYDLDTGQEIGSLRIVERSADRWPRSTTRVGFVDDGNVLALATWQGIYTWRAPSWAEIAAAETNEK